MATPNLPSESRLDRLDAEQPVQEWYRELDDASGEAPDQEPASDEAPDPEPESDEAPDPEPEPDEAPDPRYEIVYNENGNYRWREVGSEG